MSSNATIMFVN